jgi:hypothetical protein
MTSPRHRPAKKPPWSACVGPLAAALLVAIVAPASAAEPVVAPVYKCPQAGGTMLYADYPCKGGAVVDIRPGVAAPDASEQLARARDELDRAAARRQAIDAAAALRRREIDWQRESAAAQAVDAAAYAPDTSYLPVYGYYAPYASLRPHRPNTRPHFDPPRVAERRVPAVIRRP